VPMRQCHIASIHWTTAGSHPYDRSFRHRDFPHRAKGHISSHCRRVASSHKRPVPTSTETILGLDPGPGPRPYRVIGTFDSDGQGYPRQRFRARLWVSDVGWERQDVHTVEVSQASGLSCVSMYAQFLSIALDQASHPRRHAPQGSSSGSTVRSRGTHSKTCVPRWEIPTFSPWTNVLDVVGCSAGSASCRGSCGSTTSRRRG
jgi:hypothetical protein